MKMSARRQVSTPRIGRPRTRINVKNLLAFLSACTLQTRAAQSQHGQGCRSLFRLPGDRRRIWRAGQRPPRQPTRCQSGPDRTRQAGRNMRECAMSWKPNSLPSLHAALSSSLIFHSFPPSHLPSLLPPSSLPPPSLSSSSTSR